MFGGILLLSSIGFTLGAFQNQARFRGTTLKYYDGKQDSAIFAAAMMFCNHKGGTLVMPKNKQLNDAVVEVSFGNSVWIGGADLYGEGVFEWIDGERFDWENWLPPNPDNHKNEDCVHIVYNTRGMWNDLPCCQPSGYVCQIPDTKSVPYEHSTLTVSTRNGSTSYFQAQQRCKLSRSRLVLSNNDGQLQSLKSKLNDSNVTEFWIGGAVRNNACSLSTESGISTAYCFREMPYVCEQVDTHDLVVSNETPTVDIGSDLNVECTASGVPTPKVTWYRDGVYVPHQKRSVGRSTLVLKNITLEDIGTYVCRAANRVGQEIRRMEGYSFVEDSSMANVVLREGFP